MHARSLPFAFLVATIAIALYACMDAIMKGLVLRHGAYQAMLWRCVVGTLLSWAIYLPRRRAWPTPPILRMHVVRSMVMAGMALLFFWGLGRIPMAQAVALAFLAPLAALLLAALVLHERIGPGAIVASLVALAGVGVILAGQARGGPAPAASLGAAAVIASALLYAVNLILMRRQAQRSSPVEIAAFQNLIIAALLLLASPVLGAVPPAGALPAVGGAATLGVVSAGLLAWAYARGEASYLAPSEYTAFIWAALLGFLVYGETVSGFTLAGAALIVVGCVVAVRGRKAVPPIEESL